MQRIRSNGLSCTLINDTPPLNVESLNRLDVASVVYTYGALHPNDIRRAQQVVPLVSRVHVHLPKRDAKKKSKQVWKRRDIDSEDVKSTMGVKSGDVFSYYEYFHFHRY